MQATSRALAPSREDRAAIHSHALAAQFDEYDDEFDDSFEDGAVRGADLAGETEGAAFCVYLGPSLEPPDVSYSAAHFWAAQCRLQAVPAVMRLLNNQCSGGG